VQIIGRMDPMQIFIRMNECGIIVYNKAVDFEMKFWCPNLRYNGSHASVCANKVRKRFEF